LAERINYITELVRENLQRGMNKKTALTVEQQVMIILRYFTSGSFMQVIGDTLGYDQFSICIFFGNGEEILALLSLFIR